MTTLDDIKQLIAGGESETCEWKKSTGQLSPAGKTLCAFLNGRGGVVLIGVGPSGELFGQEVADRTLQDVADCVRKIEPRAEIPSHRVDLGAGKEILALTVPREATLEGPFCYEGKPYERVGNTTGRMPQATYEAKLLQRALSTKSWESAQSVCTIEGLDEEEIRQTIRLGIEAGRIPEAALSGTPLDMLRQLGVADDAGAILNAAAVLFALKPERVMPQCQMRLARFRGVHGTDFDDDRQITGNAFHLLQAGLSFLRDHLPVGGDIPEGSVVRESRPRIPVAAQRELLLNALSHRDYALAGTAIHVALYDDRLEIKNAGGLAPGVSPAKFHEKSFSSHRNPKIAGVFYLRGLVDRWGQGIPLVIDRCREAGLPAPEFDVDADAMVATIYLEGDLTPLQREILRLFVSPEQELGVSAIVEAVASKKRTVQLALSELRAAGYLELEGQGRATVYRWAR